MMPIFLRQAFLKNRYLQVLYDAPELAGKVIPSGFYGLSDTENMEHDENITYVEAVNNETVELILSHFPNQYVVVKPIISADGNNTFILSKNSKQNESDTSIIYSKEKFFESIKTIMEMPNSHGLIVQPFMEGIQKPEASERSFTFFNGEFSHAVVKQAGFKGGSSSSQRVVYKDIPVAALELAKSAYSVLAKYHKKTVIPKIRVDLIGEEKDGEIAWKISEVELVELNLIVLERDKQTEMLQNALTRYAEMVIGKSGDVKNSVSD